MACFFLQKLEHGKKYFCSPSPTWKKIVAFFIFVGWEIHGLQCFLPEVSAKRKILGFGLSRPGRILAVTRAVDLCRHLLWLWHLPAPAYVLVRKCPNPTPLCCRCLFPSFCHLRLCQSLGPVGKVEKEIILAVVRKWFLSKIGWKLIAIISQ